MGMFDGIIKGVVGWDYKGGCWMGLLRGMLDGIRKVYINFVRSSMGKSNLFRFGHCKVSIRRVYRREEE